MGVSVSEAYAIRFTEEADGAHLMEWLLEPGVLRWFPMDSVTEVQDSVRHWISFSKIHSSLTVTFEGKPVGLSTLYLMPYKKVMHHCLFSIIISEAHRGKGVGSFLLNNVMALGKERFRLETLVLEVYDGNPAIHLYRRFGFEEFGRHPGFIKEATETYVDKIFMKRDL